MAGAAGLGDHELVLTLCQVGPSNQREVDSSSQSESLDLHTQDIGDASESVRTPLIAVELGAC